MKINRRKRKVSSEDIENSYGSKRKGSNKAPIEFFPSGSTLLNLVLCGKPDVGWPRARVINIVGDGGSGKTILALEACFNFLKFIKTIISIIFPKVKKTKAIYSNREGVMDFPMEIMWKGLRNAIDWKKHRFIEEVGSDIIKTIKKQKGGEAIIYIVDSWDAFPSIAESKRFNKSVKDEDEIDGSYNKEKNVYAQNFFEAITDLLRDNQKDFTLIIISQTRDNIGVKFGAKKRRSGGAALDFYTHIIPWIRQIKEVTKKKHGEERTYAIDTEVKIKRSKVWKPFRKGFFRILYDHGLDDIGSMMIYLKDHKKKKFKGFDLDKDPALFIKFIEDNNLEKQLIKKVTKIWNRVEEAFEKEVECRKKKEL